MTKFTPPSSVTTQMSKIYYVLATDLPLLAMLKSKSKFFDEVKEIEFADFEIDTNDMDFWKLVDHHIQFAEKDSKIVDEKLNRIYIYTGRRVPVFGNSFVVKQYFEINIIVHEDFTPDYRLERISDRVNQILLHNRISGFGKIGYHMGEPYQAPREFQTYKHIYYFNDRSKTLCY